MSPFNRFAVSGALAPLVLPSASGQAAVDILLKHLHVHGEAAVDGGKRTNALAGRALLRPKPAGWT
jgi:hypothetical protein